MTALASREELDLLLAHVNATHDDAVLFVARVLGSQPGATSAKVVGIDHAGLDLVTSGPGGSQPARVGFVAEISGIEDISGAALALVQHARVTSGEAGTTSLERIATELESTRTMLTTVSAVEEIHPRLRQITFAGGDLTTFAPAGPDTYLYVLLPPPGKTELTIDQSFSWEGWRDMPDDVRPVGAYYTLRAWRPEVAELDMLFVLHEPAGPASKWAAVAKPGDPVALWGPRDAFSPPPDTTSLVLVADDTGLPAVATIIESVDDDVTVTVIAEVDSPAEQQPLAARSNVSVQWVYRNGVAPGVDHATVVDAVRALEVSIEGLYVWGAGETKLIGAIRRHVRQELGMGRDRVSLVAYWRHASTVADDDHDEE